LAINKESGNIDLWCLDTLSIHDKKMKLLALTRKSIACFSIKAQADCAIAATVLECQTRPEKNNTTKQYAACISNR